jgi:AraC-like DNA-binding protein
MGNRTKDADQYLVLYFEELVEALSVYEEKREDNLSQSENRSIVCRIIQRIARIILKTVIESNWSESDFIEKTMAIMKENINRDISMSDIADRLGIGVSTFSRKFKKETGMTPADSLQRLRCKEARRLFEEFPKISITELTFRVGFSNTQYFAKVFKKYTGMTPGGYKKSIRN